jgi:ZIP family zinc transporter
MVLELAPIVLGFIAGITVLLGALLILYSGRKASGTSLGFLNGLAGGVLAYLALEAGSEVSEYVEGLAKWDTLADFLVAFIVTSVALIGTWLILAGVERRLISSGGISSSVLTATIVAIALGLHNVGEGFAIAASLLAGRIASALLFTVGFAVHNLTEGFAIAGPFFTRSPVKVVDKRLVSLVAGLSLLAGLPVVPGALVYYLGVSSELFTATLLTIATASIIYAMLHINLSALAKLGGVSGPLFWISIFSGIALAYTTETIILFSIS